MSVFDRSPFVPVQRTVTRSRRKGGGGGVEGGEDERGRDGAESRVKERRAQSDLTPPSNQRHSLVASRSSEKTLSALFSARKSQPRCDVKEGHDTGKGPIPQGLGENVTTGRKCPRCCTIARFGPNPHQG